MPTPRSRQSLLRLAAALSVILSFGTILCAQTVNPPQYPLTSLPYPYLYMNHPATWAYMAPQNTNTTRTPFLPNVPLTRIVGSVHWPNIEPSASQSSWDPALAGIGTGSFPASQSDCTLLAPGANAGKWWVNASCWGGANGTYTASPNNILYTFYNVPQWASVTHGTYPTTTSPTGWRVTNVSTTGDCTSSTGCSTVLTISMTSGATGLATHAYVDVNISDSGGTGCHRISPRGHITEIAAGRQDFRRTFVKTSFKTGDAGYFSTRSERAKAEIGKAMGTAGTVAAICALMVWYCELRSAPSGSPRARSIFEKTWGSL